MSTPVTGLTAASALDGTELLALEQAGAARKLTTGELINNVARVADATGTDSAADTAAINAAFVAAGNGGVVEFPPDQTYLCEGTPGAQLTTIPAKVNGNGCILKVRDQIATTLVTAITEFSTTATLTDSTGFFGGDKVYFSGANGFTYEVTLDADPVANVITFPAPAWGSGTDVEIGGAVTVADSILQIRWPLASGAAEASVVPLEVSGFIFDGNSANWTAGVRWLQKPCLVIDGDSAGTTVGGAWVHHCTFRNMGVNAFFSNDLPRLTVSDNKFYNVFGSGLHIGGGGFAQEHIYSNNQFENIYQLASAAAAETFGHVVGSGAICTSNGPKIVVVSNNVVNGCGSYGFDGVSNSFHEDYTISNNVFVDCDWGGFNCGNAIGQTTVSGNIITRCGGDTLVEGLAMTTKITQSSTGTTTVIGNVFTDSVLLIKDGVQSVNVTGNTFRFLGKQLGTRELGALVLNTSGGVACKNIAISGNVFRGPATTAESTAVSDNQLPAIYVGVNFGLTITGNQITGGRQGVYINTASLENCLVGSNTLTDQFNEGGANSAGIQFKALTVGSNISVSSNAITRSEANSAGGWNALLFANTTTCTNVHISDNNITSTVTAAGGNNGFSFGSNTGAGVSVRNNTVRQFETTSWHMRGDSFTSAAIVEGNEWSYADQNRVSYASATTTIDQVPPP